MPFLQEIIHKFETSGMRHVRFALLCLAVIFIGVAYDLRCYKNMDTVEAMDSAQLARNIAEGKGYTTQFIRPFSMYLVARQNKAKGEHPAAGEIPDYSEIRTAHPDISNPPVYPVILAGLMKFLPCDFTVSTTGRFWSNDGHFWRYEPDFLIALFNELLFVAVVALTFFWARRLFDARVAWTSAALLLGTELLWRFSTSGLSTMLLLLEFVGLIWCLTLLESEMREPKRGKLGFIGLCAATGLLLGAGCLTRYSFGWLLVPVVAFVVVFGGSRRVSAGLVVFAAFAITVTPWLARNWNLSGVPFGTATYHVLENSSPQFSEYKLERSLDPTIRVSTRALWIKLINGTKDVLEKNTFDLGGGWIAALFLVGLLVGFRNPAVRRLRYFLLASIGVLIVIQALGRTQLSVDSPQINSENLLVLFIPPVIVFGISLFYILLDQVALPVPELRYVIIGCLGVLVCLPMIFALLPPKTIPVAYPPYFPPAIQRTASWLKQNELMMSDVPWAVAWYGHRQCVWLTLNVNQDKNGADQGENFFAINDYQKPINALYLTPLTMDSRFLTDWVRAGDTSWGEFILNSVVRKKVPAEFPLRQSPGGFLPEQLFLADWKRWQLADQAKNQF